MRPSCPTPAAHNGHHRRHADDQRRGSVAAARQHRVHVGHLQAGEPRSSGHMAAPGADPEPERASLRLRRGRTQTEPGTCKWSTTWDWVQFTGGWSLAITTTALAPTLAISDLSSQGNAGNAIIADGGGVGTIQNDDARRPWRPATSATPRATSARLDLFLQTSGFAGKLRALPRSPRGSPY
jgi:hypothetical protein